MTRIYQDFIGGETDADLSDSDTSLSSPALAAMQAVASPFTMEATVDPDGIAGAPERVRVTAHTASATTATITRGVGGTTARAHLSGIEWVHAFVSDEPLPLSGAGSPESVVTAPVGTLYLRTDGGTNTTLYVKESGTGNTGWAAK